MGEEPFVDGAVLLQGEMAIHCSGTGNRPRLLGGVHGPLPALRDSLKGLVKIFRVPPYVKLIASVVGSLLSNAIHAPPRCRALSVAVDLI